MSTRTPWQRLSAILVTVLMVTTLALATNTVQEAPEAAAEPPSADVVFSDSDRLQTYSAERPVAPGVTLTSFDLYGPDAVSGDATWLQGSVLTADLTGETRLDRIFPGQVAEREELTTMANRVGAVAGVNASYFDISSSGAPWGVGVTDGTMQQSPHIKDPKGSCVKCSVVVTESGMAAIGEILFEGTITLPGGTARLDALNKPHFQIADGIMAYTPVWGSYSRNARSVDEVDQQIEVVVTGGKVSAITPVPGEGQLPEGSFTLVGRGSGVAPLAALAIGDPVSIEYDFRSADDQKVRAAASGRQLLVADGVALKPRVTSSDADPHPRTAIGFSADGTRMFMLNIDGRQPEFSAGVSLDELARMMADLGAHTALNLDGGGSTTMVAREVGGTDVVLVNRPSEIDDDEDRPEGYTQRPVPDGLGLFTAKGSGELSGFWLETTLDPNRNVGPSFTPRLRTDRVFPGLTRQITAAPHDETYAAARLPEGTLPQWSSSDTAVGRIDHDGVFTAAAPGQTTITAALSDASGNLDLTVLGALARIRSTQTRIDLSATEDKASFDVIGYDEAGYSAPIDPADVQLTYDRSVLDITVSGDGQLVVTATPFAGTQTVQATVGGSTITIEVTFGLVTSVVDDFEGVDDWNLWTMRADGTWGSTADGFVGKAGKLAYDFTQSDQTRGVGIWPAEDERPVPGEPAAFQLRVNSDEPGMRARLEVVDANGKLFTVEPGSIEKSGWQQLTYVVPEDAVYPVKLRRIYFNEIDRSASYRGTTLLDELVALQPAPVELEEVVLDDFQNLDNWRVWTMRATGDWTASADGHTGGAGRLGYDFTQSDLTRGIGIWPTDGYFAVPGKPTEFRLRVNSDPAGLRARIEIMDARGVLRTVQPGFVEDTGWQQITYRVPDDVVYPIKLRRIYFNEIEPSANYQGVTLLDELTALQPVTEPAPQPIPVPDRVVRHAGVTSSPAWQFGVVSQFGVSADEPDGAAAREARRVLRQMRSRDVRLVIINGGFVATGSKENFALAKKILDEELGDIEYRYVPGPTELSDGSLAAFTEVFGPVRQVIDQGGVRFVLLDTSQGTYREGSWEQLPQLRTLLDRAADDREAKSLVVVQVKPLRDTVPPADAQLEDRKEAATVETWLSDFQERSGKTTLFIGAGEPTFGAARVDGVAQVTVGAGSVAQASGAPYGGFAGWSLFGVDGKPGTDGLRAEFVPRVDDVQLRGPAKLAVGESTTVTATVVQDGTTVPVHYPMDATWTGSPNVSIAGSGEKPGPRHVAVFDPATGTLSALGSGTITLTLTVNSRTIDLTVALNK